MKGAEIRGAVGPLRRSHAHKVHVALAHIREIRREMEISALESCGEFFGETGLEKWRFTALKLGDPLGIHIDPHDIVPQFRHAYRVNCTKISEPNNRDFHIYPCDESVSESLTAKNRH